MSVVKAKHFTVNESEVRDGGYVRGYKSPAGLNIVSSKPKSDDWTSKLTLKDDINNIDLSGSWLEPSVQVMGPKLYDKLREMSDDNDTLGKELIEYTGNLSQEEIRKREQSKEVIKY